MAATGLSGALDWAVKTIEGLIDVVSVSSLLRTGGAYACCSSVGWSNSRKLTWSYHIRSERARELIATFTLSPSRAGSIALRMAFCLQSNLSSSSIGRIFNIESIKSAGVT